MRHRRRSPYSRLEALQHSRRELVGLILSTMVLGIVPSLLSDMVSRDLARWLPRGWRYVLVSVVVLALTGLVVKLFYLHSESRRVRIEVQIPSGTGYALLCSGRPDPLSSGSSGSSNRPLTRCTAVPRRWVGACAWAGWPS